MGQSLNQLPPSTTHLLRKADLLVAGERIQAAWPDFSGRRMMIKAPLNQLLDELAREIHAGSNIVVLVGGDPCFYGIGPLLVRRLGHENVRLHPGTTTLQAVAAQLGVSWEDIPTVSLHGRDRIELLFTALARNTKVAVYSDERRTPAILAAMLLERGAENFRMLVFENLGMEGERAGTYSLDQARSLAFSALNLVILERVRAPEVVLTLGMAESAYVHEHGLITKRVVRSAALAALALEPDNLLWDLGAGCGSVGIEAGLLLPLGGVVAVERDERRAAMIRENIRRTNAFWVRVVHGLMPKCLEALPEPDRIFLGGGLGGEQEGGKDVLETTWDRLKPGGSLVAAVVLLESLHRAKSFLERHGLELEISQIQAGHSVPLASDLRFSTQNPVFLLSSRKPLP